MRIHGIVGVAFLAFKAICAEPQWSRGGVPYGMNITVRTIATIGTVHVPYESTSTSPGTISPHLEHTSLVSPLSTAKTINETHNTPLKSPFSKNSWYGYNTTTVGSMSGTGSSHGTCSTYVTPYRSLSGYTTTSTSISGTRPSYGTYGTHGMPYKTPPRHNSTSSIVGGTRPGHGTHGPYIPPYKTPPRHNSTSSIVRGTGQGYGTHGTYVTPYETSPRHNTTSNTVGRTRPSYGTPSIYGTASNGSPNYYNVSSSPSVTAKPSHGTFVGSSFTTAENSTSYGSVKNTTSTSRGTSSKSFNVSTIITTIYESTPSRGFPSSFVNVTKSTVTTTVFLTGSSTPEPTSPPVPFISKIPVTIPSVTTVTLRLTGSNGVISTTFTSMTLIPPPITISSVVITIFNTISFVSSTPTIILPSPTKTTSTLSVSQSSLTTSPPTPTETFISNATSSTQPSTTIATPHTSGFPIVTTEPQYSPSNTVGQPPPPTTETPGTTTESTFSLSKAPSPPPPSSPTSSLVTVPLPLITTISPSTTSSSISAPLSQLSPTTSPASSSSSQCCFVVQDTVDYNYWTDISTSTLYYSTSLTSIITHVSSYVDTVVTSVQTSYLPYINSELVKYNNAEQPMQNTNNAPGGPTTLSSGLGGTATVTYAQTINSPDPFFLYRTAKIILVPAVTEANGQLACITTSTFYPSTFNPSIPSSVLFTGINSNAEQYYSSATATTSAIVAAEISLSTPFVQPLGSIPTDYTSLTIPTPAVSDFINTKRKMARAISTGSSLALNSSVSEYGYVPNFFINFLAQDPNYVAQFPELASCFPGGPSIDPGTKISALVQGPTLVGNLVSSTTSVVHPSGCFDPSSGLCSTAANPAPPPITPLAVSALQSAPPSAPSPPPPSSPPPPPLPLPSNPPPSSPSPLVPPQNSPAASSPAAPSPYNPNELSPEQYSNLISALQVPSSPSTPPTSPVNPPPLSSAIQPPPLSTSAPPSPPPSQVIAASSPTQPPPLNALGPTNSLIPQLIPGSSPSQPPPPNAPGPTNSLIPQLIPGSPPAQSPTPNLPGPTSSSVPQFIPGSSPPPPPTSLQTSLSPSIIASVSSSESSTTTSEPAAITSIEHSKGGASRGKGKPVSALWHVSLGCLILTIF